MQLTAKLRSATCCKCSDFEWRKMENNTNQVQQTSVRLQRQPFVTPEAHTLFALSLSFFMVRRCYLCFRARTATNMALSTVSQRTSCIAEFTWADFWTTPGHRGTSRAILQAARGPASFRCKRHSFLLECSCGWATTMWLTGSGERSQVALATSGSLKILDSVRAFCDSPRFPRKVAGERLSNQCPSGLSLVLLVQFASCFVFRIGLTLVERHWLCHVIEHKHVHADGTSKGNGIGLCLWSPTLEKGTM